MDGPGSGAAGSGGVADRVADRTEAAGRRYDELGSGSGALSAAVNLAEGLIVWEGRALMILVGRKKKYLSLSASVKCVCADQNAV